MVSRNYTTTFYLPLLKLACIFLKVEVYNVGSTTRGGTPSSNFFLQKVYFVLLFASFFRRYTIISDLGFDLECVLILQQLLCFTLEPRHSLCKKTPWVQSCFILLQSFKFFSPTPKITMLFNFRMTLKWYKSIRIRSFKTFKF